MLSVILTRYSDSTAAKTHPEDIQVSIKEALEKEVLDLKLSTK